MRRALSSLFAALVVLVLLALGLTVAATWLVNDDRRLPQAPLTIDIPPGSGLNEIAAQLKQEDVVSSARLFSWYARSRHLGDKIQAAEYDLPAHASMRQILDVLALGGHPAAVWVTVPEGFTARQIGLRLAAAGLVDAASFERIVRQTNLTIAGQRSHGLEGYLFPDTYLVPRHASAAAIAAIMTRQFVHELPPRAAVLARRLGYTIPQVVVVASMVEREAKVDSERALMAGVYYNRLRIGMPLEVDATIEYALPQHKTALSFKDLTVDSPYNTYVHSGLPPTPIANPGRKSLLAAFHPTRSDYLYYVYRGNGHHEFSRTLEEQQAAERKYLR